MSWFYVNLALIKFLAYFTDKKNTQENRIKVLDNVTVSKLTAKFLSYFSFIKDLFILSDIKWVAVNIAFTNLCFFTSVLNIKRNAVAA